MKRRPATSEHSSLRIDHSIHVSRRRPLVVIGGLAVGTLAMLFTGAAEATLLNDPGPYVRFGLPAAKLVFNVAMSLTLGALMFALLILPRTQTKGRGRQAKPTTAKSTTPVAEPLNALWEKTLKIAEVASIAWTISAVAVLVFTFADTVGAQAYLDFSNQLGVFLTQIAFGQLWTLIVVLIAVASTLCFGTRSFLGIAVAGVLGVGVMIPWHSWATPLRPPGTPRPSTASACICWA